MKTNDHVVITLTGVEGEVVNVAPTEVLIKHKATIDGQIKEVLQWYSKDILEKSEEKSEFKRAVLMEDESGVKGIATDGVNYVVGIDEVEKEIVFGIIPEVKVKKKKKKK